MELNKNDSKSTPWPVPAGESIKEFGNCTWQSPSNIALVKYWGKKHEQLPCNPSISFTLNYARTTTSLEWKRKEDNQNKAIDFNFYFEGRENQKFKDRIQIYLNRLAEEIPLLTEYYLTIRSENTFPHSSGIASSASAMSALAAAVVDMEKLILGKETLTDFQQKVSRLSRLGSGSACRSIFPKAALWGATSLDGSNDEYAIGLESKLHPVFRNYRDVILLVDQGEKKVSSSAGHQLMNDNPYAKVRYKTAHENSEKLLSILAAGDLEDFTELVEEEALSLHALMMASSPGYILMQPNTLKIIERIRAFRKDTGIPVCFTLDAGPNVHMLFPREYKNHMYHFIHQELRSMCAKGDWIDDKIGDGIKKIE